MTDQRTIEVVRASGAYRGADAALRALEAGWRTSWSRAVMRRLTGDGVRFWSIAALTASATVLALAPLGTDPRPLGWLVPSAVGAVSLFVLVSSSR